MKKTFFIMTSFMIFCAVGFAQNAEELGGYSGQLPATAKKPLTWVKLKKGFPKQ